MQGKTVKGPQHRISTPAPSFLGSVRHIEFENIETGDCRTAELYVSVIPTRWTPPSRVSKKQVTNTIHNVESRRVELGIFEVGLP